MPKKSKLAALRSSLSRSQLERLARALDEYPRLDSFLSERGATSLAKSRDPLAIITPEEFRSLAYKFDPKEETDRASPEARAALFQEKLKSQGLNSLPELGWVPLKDPQLGGIDRHQGRARSYALEQLGAKKIPVKMPIDAGSGWLDLFPQADKEHDPIFDVDPASRAEALERLNSLLAFKPEELYLYRKDLPLVKKNFEAFAKGGKVKTAEEIQQWLKTQYVKNKLPQVGFFSTLDALIEDAPFEKAPLEQWKNYLKPGRTLERGETRFPLKQEELEYAWPKDLDEDWAKAWDNPSIDKNELRARIQRHRPDFRLGVGIPEIPGSKAQRARFPEEFEIPERQVPEFEQARYSDYSHGQNEFGREAAPYEESWLRSLDFGQHQTHFGPDVISHSRTTVQPTNELRELTDEGYPEASAHRLMRLIEEIQSDRHQAAAERLRLPAEQAESSSAFVTSPRRGYRTPQDEEEISDLQRKLDDLNLSASFARSAGPASSQSLLRRLEESKAPIEERWKQLRSKLPDAPFKDPADYAAFELRNQLLNAAKQGQDYLGLIRGADVSKRFIHDPEQATGTAFTYDKVYRKQLEKLARQYGTEVRDVGTNLQESIDTATPTMRSVNSETIHDFMNGSRDLIDDGDEDDIEMGFGGLRNVVEEMRDVNPNLADQLHTKIAAFEDADKKSGWESAIDRSVAWRKLSDDLETLHFGYRNGVMGKLGPAINKSFPSMVLTPEVRKRVLESGVPIWSLAGLAAGLPALGANEEPQGFAEGGDVSLDWLKAKVDADPEAQKAIRRMNAGLASQWYGVDEEGNLKPFGGMSLLDLFPGLNIKRELKNIEKKRKGEKVPIGGAPGIVDELRTLLFGSDRAAQAEERLAALKNKIYGQLELEEPHGFHERAQEALGTMFGQPPIPMGAAAKGAVMTAPAVTGGIAARLARLGKKIAEPAAEWFFPTVHPTPVNYATGAGFGAGVGALGDYLEDKDREEREIENFQASWNENHPGFEEGGKVEGTEPLRSMLETLRERMNQLNSGLPGFSSFGSIQAPVTEEPIMKAKGGKVDNVVSLLKKLKEKEAQVALEKKNQELSAVAGFLGNPSDPTSVLGDILGRKFAVDEAARKEVDPIKKPKASFPPKGHDRIPIEVYKSVEDFGGNFNKTAAYKWTDEELLEHLADDLEDAGLDRELAKEFKVHSQPNFLEFDSGNPSHATGYWDVEFEGPREYIDAINKMYHGEE